MGGAIFKESRRITTKELEDLIVDVSGKLNSLGIENKALEYFKTKEDHGDLDLVCKGDVISDKSLIDLFGEIPISRNGKTVSFLYDNVQIDLNFHKPEDFRSAFDFYRLGDVGQIVGRIAHALGLKYGHFGLSFPVKLSDCEEVGEINISQNTQKIMKFFDLDYNQWLEGFNDQVDMFEWVIKSKYFNPSMFAFENLNNINKVRNKKRPMYAALVKYLEDLKTDREYLPVPKNKTEYLWKALIHFSQMYRLDDIRQMLCNYSDAKEANAIFNGNDVKELLGIEGKELGKVYKQFENYCLSNMTDYRYEITDTPARKWQWFRLNRDKSSMYTLFRGWYETTKNC
jgi:hypothetical protein